MFGFIKRLYKAMVSEKNRIRLHYIRFSIRGYLYTGSKVTCVCCGKSFSKFLTYGKVRRQNAACPSCNSLERNRLLLLYLREKTNFFTDNLKVLHFAPEYKLEKIFKKSKNLEYISADINPALAMVAVDIQAIHFPDNHFDLIICSHVLGHVPDEYKALSEMRRVLKPEGSALIMTKIFSELHTTYEGSDHNLEDQQIFRKHGSDFSERLKIAGFEVAVIDYAKELGASATEKFGLGKNELIFHCRK